MHWSSSAAAAAGPTDGSNIYKTLRNEERKRASSSRQEGIVVGSLRVRDKIGGTRGSRWRVSVDVGEHQRARLIASGRHTSNESRECLKRATK